MDAASEPADQATGGAGQREATQTRLWRTPSPGRSEVRALSPFFLFLFLFLFVGRHRLLVIGSSGISLAIPRWLCGLSSVVWNPG
jgi:hypothetical protein